MKKIERINAAKLAWERIKTNAAKVDELFGTGSYFTIDATDNADLSGFVSHKLYAYLGVEDNKIIFILVPDSLDDKKLTELKDVELDAIRIKDYESDFDFTVKDVFENVVDGSDVTVDEALKRHYRWTIGRKKYVINEVASQTGLMELMVMPYTNVKTAFQNTSIDSMIFSFGLNSENAGVTATGWFADMIGWGVLADGASDTTNPLNTMVPCPPYGR